MRRARWISLALVLIAGLACSPPRHAVPESVLALGQGARWVEARSEIALGEPIEMRLWVALPSTQTPPDLMEHPPSIDKATLKHARLEAQGRGELNLREDKTYWSRAYRLTWLRMGEQTLPGFDVQFDGYPEKLTTQTLDFDIKGVLSDKDSKAAEIPLDLLQEAPTSRRTLYVILGVVLLALGVGWWLQRRLRGRMREVESGPGIQPIVEARERLAVIEREWQNKRLDGESLVVEVSSLLRRYLQKGLGFQSLTHTTEEFLDELRSSARVPATVEAPMSAFLQQCDLIKFAAQGTDAEICLSLLEKTRLLLDAAEELSVPSTNGSPVLRQREEVHHG